MRRNRSSTPRAAGRACLFAGGVLFALAFAPAASAMQDPTGGLPPELLQQEFPIDPAIRTGQLDNGLRFFIRANSEPRGRAELRLVVDAGSILEEEDQRGLAHFVEHMAFRGTEGFERQALVRYLEGVGMRFGPDLNAYTGFDETVYMLQLPTDDDEVLRTGVRILEEWAHRITFDPEEIERERGVVMEEWRARRGAQARVGDRQVQALFDGSLYRERLPIGDTAVIRGAPPERLVAFYRDWYRPDLMTVVAVGDFDAEWMEGVVRERFEGVPAVADPRPRPAPEVPGHEETLFSLTTDPELGQSQVAVVFKLPAREQGTIGAYRQGLLERLHDGMLNDRLHERTQEAEPPFLGAGTGQISMVRSAEVYQLGAAVEDGRVETGLEALLTEVRRVALHGFTETELERQKIEMRRRMERALAEQDRRHSGQLAGEYVRHALEGEPIPALDFEVQVVQALLPTIGLDEVNELARERLPRENRVILASAPEREGAGLPSEAELLAVFDRVQGSDVEAYVADEDAEELMDQLPEPGSVVEEHWIEELETHHWVLSNGVEVYVRPTDFRDDEVQFQGWGPGGVSLADGADLVPAQSAVAVIGSSGLGAFDALALDRRLAGTVAAVNPTMSERAQGLLGSASPTDLETMFQLAHLRVTEPRRDETRFQAYLAQMRAGLQNRGAQPIAVFQDSLQVIMSGHHPRSRPPGPHLVEEMDLDRAYAFYRERFGDLSGWVFILVGTIDVDELKPLVERYLASLPASGTATDWVDHGVRTPTDDVHRTIRMGVEPQAVTQIVLHRTGELDQADRDRYAILVDVLEIRLREVLREGMGGTYGVSVSGSTSREPEPSYSLAIGFGADPERVEELRAAVFAEVERLAGEGPAADEVSRAREAHRRSREVSHRQNAWWRGQLLSYHRYGTDPARITSPDLFAPIGEEELREAAGRLLSVEPAIVVTLLPEAAPGGD